MTRTWPDDWESRRRGEGCEFCGNEGTLDTGSGVRFFVGAASEAYLQRRPVSPGYSIVVFRGRHVGDLVDFTAEELTAFWGDVVEVARRLCDVFAACHVNYQVYGNEVPHVHVHVKLRFLDDASPGRPLPHPSEIAELPSAELGRQLSELDAIS